MNKVRIESNGLPTGTHICVDGAELTNVTHLTFEVGGESTAKPR